MGFQDILRNRILDVLESWEVRDQYAIMLFIYPNETYEYGGYSNIPEITMLYKCESDLPKNSYPADDTSNADEERWNPAFWWNCREEQPIIRFGEPNPIADALIAWYQSTKIQNIGYEDPEQMYDNHMRYIGKGPNGLPELLNVICEIAKGLQNDGIIEAKFGRRIPIILADYEFTWYMVVATRNANPNGEANDYIEACLREGWAFEEQIICG